jgi:hypothetical protein
VRILPDAALSIIPLSSSPEEVPRCEIVLNRGRTGVTLDGAILEAALSWRDYFLIFLTDNIPHEDSLRIYLLDANLTVVDSASMGGMYVTGAFADLRLCPPDVVRFRFFGEVEWELMLLGERTFALPGVFGTVGVSRPFRCYRWFELERCVGQR